MQNTKIVAPANIDFDSMQKMNNENKVSKKTPRVRIQSVDSQGFLHLYWVNFSGVPTMTLSDLNNLIAVGHCVITNITVLKEYFTFKTHTKSTVGKATAQKLDIDGLCKYCNEVKKQIGEGYGMTVAELTLYCLDAISNGCAGKRVFISRDDEGNGFHGLVFPFILEQNKLVEVDTMNDVPHDGSAVILG